MIKITVEELDQGLNLLDTMETCTNSHNCLWLKRSILSKASNALLEDCPDKKCQIPAFRITLENFSPAFYAEALKLSRFDEVSKTTVAMLMKRKTIKRKKQEKLIRRVHDLYIFGELFVLAVYPLSLAAKKIPFLKPTEITEFRNHYREAEIRQTVKEMEEINSEWRDWVTSTTQYFLSTYERYPYAATYLVYLFSRGIEKDQLPDLQNMPQNEKDEFFSEIQKAIAQNKKTDR